MLLYLQGRSSRTSSVSGQQGAKREGRLLSSRFSLSTMARTLSAALLFARLPRLLLILLSWSLLFYDCHSSHTTKARSTLCSRRGLFGSLWSPGLVGAARALERTGWRLVQSLGARDLAVRRCVLLFVRFFGGAIYVVSGVATVHTSVKCALFMLAIAHSTPFIIIKTVSTDVYASQWAGFFGTFGALTMAAFVDTFVKLSLSVTCCKHWLLSGHSLLQSAQALSTGSPFSCCLPWRVRMDLFGLERGEISSRFTNCPRRRLCNR